MKSMTFRPALKNSQGLRQELFQSLPVCEAANTGEKEEIKASLRGFLLSSKTWKSYGVQLSFDYMDNNESLIEMMLFQKAKAFSCYTNCLLRTRNPRSVYRALRELDDDSVLERHLMISFESLTQILSSSIRNAESKIIPGC